MTGRRDDKVTKWKKLDGKWVLRANIKGDDVPILVRRVTERDDAQKRILKCLGISGIDRLNQSKYL